MIDIAQDIQSLSRFKRSTNELLDRIKKTGNPLVLTINGKAELVARGQQSSGGRKMAGFAPGTRSGRIGLL